MRGRDSVFDFMHRFDIMCWLLESSSAYSSQHTLVSAFSNGLLICCFPFIFEVCNSWLKMPKESVSSFSVVPY